MDGQLLLTWFVVGLAGAYALLRVGRTWRGLRGGKNCGGGCGCSKTLAAPEQPAAYRAGAGEDAPSLADI